MQTPFYVVGRSLPPSAAHNYAPGVTHEVLYNTPLGVYYLEILALTLVMHVATLLVCEGFVGSDVSLVATQLNALQSLCDMTSV